MALQSWDGCRGLGEALNSSKSLALSQSKEPGDTTPPSVFAGECLPPWAQLGVQMASGEPGLESPESSLPQKCPRVQGRGEEQREEHECEIRGRQDPTGQRAEQVGAGGKKWGLTAPG